MHHAARVWGNYLLGYGGYNGEDNKTHDDFFAFDLEKYEWIQVKSGEEEEDDDDRLMSIQAESPIGKRCMHSMTDYYMDQAFDKSWKYSRAIWKRFPKFSTS